MQRLWKLTNDLTAQLVFNRSATLELKQQLATLQSAATGHAPIYAISGNRDPGDYQLRLENERLREENLQLQEQLREYERWMEFIMGKFRLQNLAMAQCRKESMEEAYKVAEQGGEAAMRLQEENALLQSRLADLSAVARKAINEEYYTTETVIESLETENRCLREMLGLAEGGNGAFMGRFSFHVDEDDDEDALRRHRRNRVSFPSTSTGSDNEQLSPRPLEQETHMQPLSQPQPQPLSEQSPWQYNQHCRFVLETPVPLSVQTGLRSPTSTISTSPRSLSSMSPSTSTPSPSWSPSTSTSSPTMASSAPYSPEEQFKSISPPLDGTIGRGSMRYKSQRGKITINTNVGSPNANQER